MMRTGEDTSTVISPHTCRGVLEVLTKFRSDFCNLEKVTTSEISLITIHTYRRDLFNIHIVSGLSINLSKVGVGVWLAAGPLLALRQTLAQQGGTVRSSGAALASAVEILQIQSYIV